MTMQQIKAPWTPDQVESLNEFQTRGFFHPFTCKICRDRDAAEGRLVDEHALVATVDGWICPTCDYTQDWAWDGMIYMAWLRDAP